MVVEGIGVGKRPGWEESLLEEIPKVFQERIPILVLLWSEDTRIIQTLIRQHDNGGLWEEVLGVVSLFRLHPRREGKNLVFS